MYGAETAAAGATVTVLSDGETVATLTTSPEGTYSAPGLLEGRYTVAYALENFQSQEMAFDALAGETSTLPTVVFQPQKGSISGRVTRADGLSGGATVVVRGSEEDERIRAVRRTATTSATDGGFVVTGVCPGTYQVTATAPGYRTPEFSEVVVTAAMPGGYETVLEG